MVNAGDVLNLLLKNVVFGIIIYLVLRQIATKEDNARDILITVVSVICFMLLELSGGLFKKLKELICGCSSDPPLDVSLDATLSAAT